MSDTVLTEAGGMRRMAWPGWNFFVLLLLLAFPSSGFVQKHIGLAGVAGYLGWVALVLLTTRRLTARMVAFLQRWFWGLCVMVLAGLAIGFAVVYPIENRGGFGKSSDRDDGLNLAVTRMAEGKSPYYGSSKSAGPLSVLPGGIVLAAPFVALGNSAYQNMFWLVGFLVGACWMFRDRVIALVLLTVPLALSPAAMHEFISGGDMLANGIYVALFFLYAIGLWTSPRAGTAAKWLACVGLGVGLASRPNFLLLTPLFGALLWRMVGLRLALGAVAVVGVVVVVITVPFYLHDPSGFTPLLARQKLAVIDGVMPWASKGMIGTAALLGMIGGWRLLRSNSAEMTQAFFRWCTLVTLWPMVCAVGLFSLANGHLDFSFMSDRFGLMYGPFMLFGWGGEWLGGAHRFVDGKAHGL